MLVYLLSLSLSSEEESDWGSLPGQIASNRALPYTASSLDHLEHLLMDVDFLDRGDRLYFLKGEHRRLGEHPGCRLVGRVRGPGRCVLGGFLAGSRRARMSPKGR